MKMYTKNYIHMMSKKKKKVLLRILPMVEGREKTKMQSLENSQDCFRNKNFRKRKAYLETENIAPKNLL